MFRELLRKNNELSFEECVRILKSEKRGILSVKGDNDYPYGMPMNHWFDEKSWKIYFHCGKTGHRLDSLKKYNKVSFCIYDNGYRISDDWNLYIKSVIVFGKINIVSESKKIVSIVTKLSHKFTQDDEYINDEISQHLQNTLVLELTPEHICGKLVKES